MGLFGLKNNVRPIDNGICNVDATEIVKAIETFPCSHVFDIAKEKYNEYVTMMEEIMKSIKS